MIPKQPLPRKKVLIPKGGYLSDKEAIGDFHTSSPFLGEGVFSENYTK